MTGAARRRKQPELIRRRLLDGAARLAVERGLGAVTVEAVAAAAGVTKGGLFHHFPNKQALVEGVFGDVLDRFDAGIEARIGADPEPRGRFTRAYVAATLAECGRDGVALWAALTLSMLGEPELRRRWSDWLAARLERHCDTDGGPAQAVARLAADGAWLAHLLSPDGRGPPDLARLERELRRLAGDASGAGPAAAPACGVVLHRPTVP